MSTEYMTAHVCREPKRPVQEIIKVKGNVRRLHDVKFLGV